MEVIKFDNGTSHSVVEWVKANVKFMGNISSFEVYKDECDVPEIYRNVPDFYVYEGNRQDSQRDYHLILRDDEKEIETWLGGCNCGYGGSGPSATKEILQIVGIKMDYDMISRQSIVKMKGLVPHHDLNFVIFKPLDRLHFQKEERLNVFLTFKTAYEKWNAKRAFEALGNVHPLRDISSIVEELYDVVLPYSTEHEWYDYATNNGIVLSNQLANLCNESLIELIENIAYKYNAKFEIKDL
ncbi:TPA: hypothetical protein ACGXMH_002921 [Bacillus mobilis]|uniref:hypothetical protein n=1 Tax=Bacillus mobilis TaxID=2026190 RepID=UPI0011A2A79A|nr:hypothetical protein [Bacillus mobilis]MED4384488.1 hypothetical protein [Bacillus mobilis]HDX9641101.1 hypothetical protein [Bacillus mobilis]